MKKQFIALAFMLTMFCVTSHAQQNAWRDSLTNYINNYVTHHDVISGDDQKYFRFFAPDKHYSVQAKFKKSVDGHWFQMQTTGPMKKTFRAYGLLEFTIHDTVCKLTIYQSQELVQDSKYHDYLFLPFTDQTTGMESYHTGRYLDFTMGDIKSGELTLDFNKAYNPSCAYVSGKYSCPVPPAENNLQIAINAGEMIFGKKE